MIVGSDGILDTGIATDDGITAYLQLATPTNSPPTRLTIVDLLKYRLRQNGVALASITPQMIAELLPPEVIAGQRFDLNRPFGNGRDDNPANNIVDEPGEAEAAFWNPSNANLTTATMTAAGFTTFVPDYSNGGDANMNGTPGEAADSQMARQLYARYLYVMMMLFRGSTDIDFDGMAANTPQETAYRNGTIGQLTWLITAILTQS